MFVQLLAGLILYALDRMPGRAKNVLTLAVVLVVGGLLAQAAQGLAWLFAILLLAGSLVGLGYPPARVKTERFGATGGG